MPIRTCLSAIHMVLGPLGVCRSIVLAGYYYQSEIKNLNLWLTIFIFVRRNTSLAIGNDTHKSYMFQRPWEMSVGNCALSSTDLYLILWPVFPFQSPFLSFYDVMILPAALSASRFKD